jgi:hypothetical protein
MKLDYVLIGQKYKIISNNLKELFSIIRIVFRFYKLHNLPSTYQET